MPSAEFKPQVNAQLARIAQALASPQRLELLDYLAQTERSVDTLSQLACLTVANTSRHLQVLRQAALVQVRSMGKQRVYRLAGDDVVQLLTALRHSCVTSGRRSAAMACHRAAGAQVGIVPYPTISE